MEELVSLQELDVGDCFRKDEEWLHLVLVAEKLPGDGRIFSEWWLYQTQTYAGDLHVFRTTVRDPIKVRRVPVEEFERMQDIWFGIPF
jgi:hypothetical protein